MADASSPVLPRAHTVLRRFSFRLTRRGAILYGLLGSGMAIMQGMAFAATYTSDMARSSFATTLASNPGLGILYGELRNIETPAGYMVYRTLPFLAVVGSLWALSATTRMLRGQEDDGRLDQLLTGRYGLGAASIALLKGIGCSLLLAFLIGAAALIAIGQNGVIHASVTASLFFALALFLPSLLFVGVGALTSQLAATRRRAMTYGVGALGILFAIRSIANVIPSVAWLKWITPFGWADRLHPLTGSNGIWTVPFLAAFGVCMYIALYYASRRDTGESIIADTPHAVAHIALLKNPLGVAWRLTRGSLLGWLAAILFVGILIVSIAKTASDAAASSPTLVQALGSITNSRSAVTIAFVGFSGLLTSLLLMLCVANGFGRIRDDEAHGQAENFLAGPVSRTAWLASRGALLAVAVIGMCALSSLVFWLVARAQHIPISAFDMVFGGFNYTGPALLMLGVGTLFYGLRPQLTSILLYTWVGWSFVVEMIGSVVKLDAYVYSMSLLRHISMVPAVAVNWKTYAVLIAIGIAAFAAGLYLFSRRDIMPE